MNNEVQLIGRRGQEPEIRTLQNGSKLCTFSVATTDSYKNKQGERQETTEWHNVVVWDENLVNVLERFVSKGSQIGLKGKLKTRSYDDSNGNKRYTTEVVLEKYRGQIQLLSSKSETSQREQDIDNFESSASTNQQGVAGDDLDLPF